MASAIELLLLAQASVQTVQVASAPTLVNSTSPVAISGLSYTVTAQQYQVEGRVIAVVAGSGTPQAGTIRLTGTATASAMSVKVTAVQTGTGATYNLGLITAINADPSATSGSWPLSSTILVDFSGIVTFSAAGTFGVAGRVITASADATWTSQALSWMDVVPL